MSLTPEQMAFEIDTLHPHVERRAAEIAAFVPDRWGDVTPPTPISLTPWMFELLDAAREVVPPDYRAKIDYILTNCPRYGPRIVQNSFARGK